MLLAGLLSGAEVALPLLDGILPIPPGVFAALTLGRRCICCPACRPVVQKELSDEK